MRVTVIGDRGQVARALAERTSPAFEITRLGREAALDLETVVNAEPVIRATHQDVVVNAAAWTDVEGAELAPDTAFCVNATGAQKVAVATAALGVPLVHLSTEYVFDGFRTEPYAETDIPAPSNTYGHSKLAGEKAVAAVTDDHVILRTSWLYSAHERNFLMKILAQLGAADIGVVGDRLGAPTSAVELAHGIEQVCRNLLRSPDGSLRGIFHMTCAGETSWAGFAAEVLALSGERGATRPIVRPIPTSSLFELAPAVNSRLNCDRLARLHGIKLADWRDALALIMRQHRDGL